MMQLHKIYEAVNKGIRIALDDYEDDMNNNISSKSNVIQNDEIIRQRKEFESLFVDLGLPSGTLWCKYNLGCAWRSLNREPQNSTYEEWYGDYYAWGEIKTKNWYDWGTYKYSKHYTDFFEENELLKYCLSANKGYEGFVDKLTQLKIEDDAVYNNLHLYNFKFYTPTKEQCEELLTYTRIFQVKNYKGVDKLNGLRFVGHNANEIFIPFAGFNNSNKLCNENTVSIWTSNILLDSSSVAWYLFGNDYNFILYDMPRCNGLPIRPIYNIK